MPLSTVNWSNARSRPADYIQICENIADTYPNGLSHGVQKDAIQNGLDAVRGTSPLKFAFELLKNIHGRFLTMTDANTIGLTGRVIERPEEYLDDLPEDERWARFESFAFTKQDPDAIGARSQGKFVFLAASKEHTMLYDTLWEDGVYRLGITKATHVDCPMKHWEGEEAQEKLDSLTGLEPLREVGTRIIIVDPVDPLVEDIRTGVFLAAIEETWFRLVEKKQAHICLRADGAEMQAKVPFPFPIPLEDTDDVKVWLKEGDHITAGDTPYRIKRLHVGWRSDGRVREELQGMAVIHNRMKVCSIPMMWGEPGIRDAVFGYVEFDRELDRELRKTGNQRPNHYDLDWRRTIPGAIKHYVEAELLHYGQEKLGLGVDPRKRQQRARSEAEQWALRQLAVLTPDFDLMAAHHGTRRPPTRPGQPSDKTVGLTFHVVRFPNPRRAPLVRWNERLAGFTVEAFNEQETTYSCRGQVHVFRANRQILRLVDQRAVVLRPHASVPFGPLEIHFTRQLFPEPERYTLRATLINEVNGQRLDELNRYLWVEKEPPFRAPFDVQPAELPPPYDSYQWRMVPTGDDYFTLYYNTAHPAYLHSEDMGTCRLYCFEIFLEGALELVLDRPVGDNGVRDYHPLDRAKVEESPKDSYSELIRMLSKVRHRFYEGLR